MDRIPPQNIDIEAACLSCALLNKQALNELKANVTKEDFYLDKHRVFFDCITTIPVQDWTSIQTWYRENNLEISHNDYVMIFEGSASSAGIDYYIKQLLEYSAKRNTIVACQDTINGIYENQNIDESLASLNKKLREIHRAESIKTYSSEDLFKGKTLEDISFNKDDFVKTGIQDFDEFFYGLYKSELVVIAGRPSTGKSALAMNIAMNHSREEPVIYISLEMPEKFFKIRMLACESMINSTRIQHNWKMSDVEKEKIQDAIDRLAKRKFFVIDKSGLKKETIDNKIRQVHEKHGLGMFVVDYLQIMGTSSREQRYIRIGEDLLMLKDLARDLNIPGIVISSKSRASESSKDLLSGFRESGNIEYDADKAMFLEYEDWEGNISNESVQGQITLAKNKNGSIGFAPITFYKAYSKFI